MSRASVTVDGEVVGAIGHGWLVLLGVGPNDDEAIAARMADKIVGLRVFEDEAGKMNRSVVDVGGGVLVVSQFTLYADTSRGRRPGFTGAAPPAIAEPLVRRVAGLIGQRGLTVATGQFGAHMAVELVNDGPVTIIFTEEPVPERQLPAGQTAATVSRAVVRCSEATRRITSNAMSMSDDSMP